ncbi:hypothetical protein TRIP_B200765 [uncultured Desulfatiglans sp.]|nr:hypothetical protein TRIP_B200765 [uncultured Desulfatiglans sp.]
MVCAGFRYSDKDEYQNKIYCFFILIYNLCNLG